MTSEQFYTSMDKQERRLYLQQVLTDQGFDAIAAIAVVGIWFWRTWGLWVYLTCWAIAFGLNAFLGVPFWSYVLLLSNVALLYALLRPRRESFR